MSGKVTLSTVEILKNNGYAFEIHHVVTDDGYILELHRIPNSKNGKKPTRNHPVFIHHGILGSSADWVLGGAKISLPMQLADFGYDVWLANCRGNTYSRKHKSMIYTENDFWDFSLNEIGKYDLPAAIDYILMKTKAPQVHYIGYSMGTTLFYIMASERPEYQPKIRSQISLAPVAYLYNTKSFIRHLTSKAQTINKESQNLTHGMLFYMTDAQKIFASTMAHIIIQKRIIQYILFQVCGSDPNFFNSDLIPHILGHLPAGTSGKLVEHFAQLILNDYFAQYDYGSPELNMEKYNSKSPPLYDLSSIQVPITLIYGENDILADTEDVMKLRDHLPKVMKVFPSNNPYCNHLDFLWGKTVNKDINDPIKLILETTDDMNWVYTKPKPTNSKLMFIKDDDRLSDYMIGEQLPQNLLNPVSNLEDFEKYLDAIIWDTMPHYAVSKDHAMFKQEYAEHLKLFRALIKHVKSIRIQNSLEETDDTLTAKLNSVFSFLEKQHS